ncbi:1-acyl-sn-glycerol-3-phosphate acyltransferase [Aeromicrobium sp. CTD01-1L150]|uniref:lysophospholipid acyltransferase family protein n=1 Tax=Aeromicrobium sp. CTD01-1L150 TaxID=3341830 RepID=UPI0035BF3C4F
MNDDRRTIGTNGPAGRGTRAAGSPSSASRSLAGGSAPRRGPAKKKSSTTASGATKKSAAGAANPRSTTATKKATAASRATAGTKATSSRSSAKARTRPTESKTGGEEPRLRAVTEDDAAAAAAAAAEQAARETRTAGAASMPGIAMEDLAQAFVGAAQRVLGTDWEQRLATVLSALRQRLAGDYAVDEFGFDPQITEILTSAVEPLAESWFRLEVRGAENIPTEGGALLVANHSGTVPIDGVMTGYAVKKYSGRDLRPLGADLVFALPFVGQMARKVGATLACTQDAERLLSSGEVAGVWPEGFKGIGKPFTERYKLQRFGRGGFVSSAMRAQVPIVPVSIVGAEEIYPLIGNVASLARLLGVPYLPITPFFPLLGPLGMVPLPSKWIIEFGEPIRTDAYEPEQADDPMLLFNVTDQVRETIQQTLYALLVDRGNAFF